MFALQEAMQEKQQEVNLLVESKNNKQVALAKIETKMEDLQEEVYQEMHLAIETMITVGFLSLTCVN